MSILIKNGLVLDPAKGIAAADVYITDEGLLERIEHGITDGATIVFDAQGMWVAPGLIDLHTHLREPGFTHKETIASGAAAAVAGGFATICAMPNTNPAADTPDVIRQIIAKGKDARLANVLPVGSITIRQAGIQLSDFARLKKAGACAVSEDGKSVMDEKLMEQAFIRANQSELPVFSHCEDAALVKGGVMNKGAVSDMLGLPGISRLSEESIVQRDIDLCRKTGGTLHICHISTEGGVELVRQAQQEGLNVSAEVCPHHFALTEANILNSKGADTNLKMNPPLRSNSDVNAILEGLRTGVISVIATDHAPHHADEKTGGFLKAANGIIGLETAVPLCVDRLVHKGILTPLQLIEKLTINPARILGINKGQFSIGLPADVTIIDPNETVTIDPRAFHSKSKNSPFIGWSLKGVVKMTIVNGRIVYDNR